MLPLLLAAGAIGLIYFATKSESKESGPSNRQIFSAGKALQALRGKAGEERRGIQGGIQDGSLDDAVAGARDQIEGLNRPPVEAFAGGLGLVAVNPVLGIVASVVAAFAQNFANLVAGRDVGDIVDEEIKGALKRAGFAVTDANVTFARHLFILKQYGGDLSTSNARLAVPVKDGFPLPEHSWGILFRRYMQDYLTGHARENLGGVDAPRSETNEDRALLGFIPVAGEGETPADGYWEMTIRPGWKRMRLVRGHTHGVMYERFENGTTTLRGDSEALLAYASKLNAEWSGREMVPVA